MVEKMIFVAEDTKQGWYNFKPLCLFLAILRQNCGILSQAESKIPLHLRQTGDILRNAQKIVLKNGS